MVTDYRNIADYLRASKISVEQKLNDFVVYGYEDRGIGAKTAPRAYRHRYFELSLDIDEDCCFHVDNFRYPVRGNRLIYVAPHRLQTNVVRNEEKRDSRGFTIFFAPEFPGYDEAGSMGDFGFLSPDFPPVVNLTDKQVAEVSTLFNLIRYEQKEYGEAGRAIIRNLTRVLLQKVKSFRNAMRDDGACPSLVSEFTYLCNTSFLRLHSVQDYADKLAVTPKHLTAVVREHTGLTALETIHQRKITYAKGLLAQTNLPVKQVAYELGFENPEYFSVFFKKLTGVTPNRFRKNSTEKPTFAQL